MVILNPEEARRFRNALETTPGLEEIGKVIAKAMATGSTIMIDGRRADDGHDQDAAADRKSIRGEDGTDRQDLPG